MPVLGVVQLKGGGGKSTVAGYAAQTLHELGFRPVVIDADPQATCVQWAEALRRQGTPFGWDVVPYATSGKLEVDVPGIVGDRWNAVVIDTPPTEHGLSIALSAAMASTHVIVPMPPHTSDYQRMADVRALLDRATESGAEFEHGVLLVKYDTTTVDGPVFRKQLTQDGWRVLRPIAQDWKRYKQAIGNPIHRALSSGYGDAVVELLAPPEE